MRIRQRQTRGLLRLFPVFVFMSVHGDGDGGLALGREKSGVQLLAYLGME